MSEAGKEVVILIIAHKAEVSLFESISLTQCSKILGGHPIVFICPAGLDVSVYRQLCPGASFDFIDPKWQSTYAQFNRLKIDPFLYRRYAQYRYILFYEPDAFVFEDELLSWCSRSYDYIGAPWFEGFEKATGNSPLLATGNGGFSLRKVSAHLKALESFSFCIPPAENWNDRFIERKYGNNLVKQFAGFLLDYTFRNNTFYRMNNYTGNEDRFWGLSVAKNFSWFRAATPEEAISFSMEMQPRRVYEMNGGRLPFGCHAWWKYDLAFWKPHIEYFGYHIP